MSPKLRLEAQARPGIDLTPEQVKSVSEVSGHHLLMGASGSGRTQTLVVATQKAVSVFGSENVWVVSSSRQSANLIRDRLIEIDPTKTPRVQTLASIAFAILRLLAAQDQNARREIRMLTGPGQELRIKQMIASGEITWPKKFEKLVQTKVFAADLRRWLANFRSNASELQITNLNNPEIEEPIQEFVTKFLVENSTHGNYDYVEAANEAALAFELPDFSAIKNFSPKAILLDDLHDLDLSQLNLLFALIGQAQYSFTTSNPDQAVLGFRGAGLDITKEFKDRINPQVHLLNIIHRFGSGIQTGISKFLPSLVSLDISSQEQQALRAPTISDHAPKSELNFEVSATPAIRDSLILDRIIRAHSETGLPYSKMAVIGRSYDTLKLIKRRLADAGIDVEYSADNSALGNNSSVSALLGAVQLAIKLKSKEQIGAGELRQFLLSPVIQASNSQLRSASTVLRNSTLQGTTDELILEAVISPKLLLQVENHEKTMVLRHAGALLHSIKARLDKKVSVAEVLWSAWSGKVDVKSAELFGFDLNDYQNSWPDRLLQLSLGQSAAARRADTELDAIVALFDAADRADRDFKGTQSVTDFITEVLNQDSAADVLVQRVQDGVTICTAHKARGRQWELVFIVDLQDGVWPAANVRESLIQARDAHGQRLRVAEERRLAAAALSATKNSALICVVDSENEVGLSPSSLLFDFELPDTVNELAPSLLTPNGLIAQLRAAAVDPQSSGELKAAAVSRLSYLAKSKNSLVSGADPQNWWFVPQLTKSDQPLFDPDSPTSISGSALESITRCPTQWFFERKLQIKDATNASAVIGSVIHQIAENISTKNMSLMDSLNFLRDIWPTKAFDSQWQSNIQLIEAEGMVQALFEWLEPRRDMFISGEQSFNVLLEEDQIILIGRIDLVEKSMDGSLNIIDFKTSNSAPSKKELLEHTQLGVYQLAVANHPVLNPGSARVSAALIQLRARKSDQKASENFAADLEDPQWLFEQLRDGKSRMINEDLPARPGAHCRNCKVKAVCPAVVEGEQAVS